MEGFSNTPSWLDERVRTYMETRSPRPSDRDRAQWIGPGKSVIVGGIEIDNAMIYVGDRLRAVENWFGGTEPALINPKLRISAAFESHRRNPLGYRMSYSSMSQESRTAFLEWLADGRRDSEIGVDYLRLFLFGLERRIIHDLHQGFDPIETRDQAAELQGIRAELQELAFIYSHFTDTAAQCSELASVTRAMLGDFTVPQGPPPRAAARWSTPEDIRFGLGCFAHFDKPIPGEWALRWLQSHPSAHFRTPSKRVPEEFERLWNVRYRDHFGDGIEVTEKRPTMSVEYRPDTWSMLGVFDFPTPLPDVTRAVDRLGLLQELADKCEDELDAYSRYVGKNTGDATGLGARALLPPELIDSSDKEVSHLMSILNECIGDRDFGVIDGRLLVSMWNPGGVQLTKTDSLALLNVLTALGFGLVPDVNYDAKPLGAQPAVLFRTKSRGVASPDYKEAQLFAQFAVHVLAANGPLTDDENRRLQKTLAGTWALSEDDLTRLSAFMLWLEATGATLTGVKQRIKAAMVEAHDLGNALIELAVPGSNIPPKTMAALHKVFAMLGLSDDMLFGTVHHRSTGRVAVPPKATGGTSEPTSRGLDMARVSRTLAESEKVSELLGDIFADDQPAVAATEPAVDLVVGLDAAHSRLLRILATKSAWSVAEVANECAALHLLPGGALDTLNEVAFDRVGDPVIDGDGDIEVDAGVAAELLAD